MLSEENRISRLEKIVEKQTFQIKILQKLAANYDMFGVFDQILSYDLNEEEYNNLRTVTNKYTEKIENKEKVTLKQFYDEIETILKEKIYCKTDNQIDLDMFIPIWLNGPNGGFGFSKKLYTYFYK